MANAFVQRSSCTKAKASQKKSISTQHIFVTYSLLKYSTFLLNFYFCDSTDVKSLINLSHNFSTDTLLLMNRMCRYFICASCVPESMDSGSQLIYTKQRFYCKSKEIFSSVQKGISVSGISTTDAKLWVPYNFISNANPCKCLNKLTLIS